MIFVFGSNLAGIHGAGAAKKALEKGAIMGIGVGMAGMTYAIPTKNCAIQTLPLGVIELYIKQFIEYAQNCYYLDYEAPSFQITRIGCGLAGFTDEQIAPLFKGAEELDNCEFDEAWKPWLPKAKFWGTF